ncbi:MAG: tetraacyldisaccharide 4'-kinase [Armatimonadota bacterium]|nr:tetraacyldisaccharide 4'-kinase [bacterium]MDW8320459.1 tetraacyldisaccharide 4'-kinase [Armatimonadota bacterium]
MLVPFSLGYDAALQAYLWWRLPRQFKADATVISVGNLSMGGTGKTPTVIAICRHLQRNGFRVAVLSRGYGGTMSYAGGVVSDGERIFATVTQAGDEPLLIARKLPGVVVLVGKDRRKTARKAIEHFGCDTLVLDDGFQYWQLHRDVDLVLLDRERPFGNGWTLPAGTLREPVRHLQRAHALLVQQTHIHCRQLAQMFPMTPCFIWQKSPSGARALHTEQTHFDLEVLRGKRVFALAAIASFGSFTQVLSQLETQLVGTWNLPDHHHYTPGDVLEAQKRARACNAEMILVTEKDAVKLEEMPAMSLECPIWVLDIEARFSQGFWRWFDGRVRAAGRAGSSQFTAAERAL